jgi:hypothetical protein
MFSFLLPICREAEAGLRGTGYLPEGFLTRALKARDGEGAWTGVALYFLLREFGLL